MSKAKAYNKIKYRKEPLSPTDAAARTRKLKVMTREFVASRKPGGRVNADLFVRENDPEFFAQNFISSAALLTAIGTAFRKLEADGLLTWAAIGEYKTPRPMAKPKRAPKAKTPDRTRLACLHLRDGLLRGDAFETILSTVPEDLSGLYSGPPALKGALSSIAGKMVGLSDEGFRTFNQRLDDPNDLASPFRGIA